MISPRFRLLSCFLLLAAVLTLTGSASALARVARGKRRYPAPALRVSGGTLKWNRIAGLGRYQVVAQRTRAKVAYYHLVTDVQLVTATRLKPRPVPGQTISYRVRADAPGASWSRKVTIAWPASPPVAARTEKLRVAVNNISGADADSRFKGIGVDWERLDIAPGDDLSYLRYVASDGMHVLPVFVVGPGGSLEGLTPGAVAADIAALTPRLRSLGITTLELGNESYRFLDARGYAALYDAAHHAAAGRITLLAPATTDYYEHARGGTSSWFRDLAAALPGGAAEVDGLTLHPYGSMTSTCGDGYGWPMLGGLHAESVAAGFSPSLPWYITEVGQQAWGSPLECQPPVSEATQAADVTQYLNDVATKYPWIAFLAFYTSRDESTDGFGLLRSDNSVRPAFQALKSWMAAHAAQVTG